MKPAAVPRVPGYGPSVAMDWGIATTAPGRGVWLVQYFTATGGHSMLVVDHNEDDKILTLEANSAYGLDGAGWGEIGNLRDVPNPGLRWMDSVTQTWESRMDGKVGVHAARLAVDPASVKRWLKSA